MLHRVLHLVSAMAPAYAANMTPPFVKYWPWWNRPIDERRLGAHKTVVGFVAGVIVAIAVVYVQRRQPWLMVGALFGVGAMGGDALKSAVKRRLGIPPGARWMPLDQIDFVLGALALTWPFLAFTWVDGVAVLALTFVGHIAVDHVAFWIGIRDTRW